MSRTTSSRACEKSPVWPTFATWSWFVPTADVRPLRGIRYTAVAGDLDKLVAPPYDVIPEADLDRYRALSPYNVVRLTRPGTDYREANRLFEAWLDDGILAHDPPSMYAHEVGFEGRRRRDLIASLRLQPYADGIVLPHERTHRGPKEDRLALMRATAVSLEPLWFLYEGAETGLPAVMDRVTAGAPAAAFVQADGTRHRLWQLTDSGLLDRIHRELAPLPLLIADGHHRYETALAFADETGGDADAPSRFTLALLTDLDDPGLVVLPTHRVMKAGIAVSGGEPKESLAETLEALRGRVAAGAYRDHRFQVLPLDGDVAVAELHGQVIDNVLGKRSLEDNLLYTRDPAEAVRWVDEGVGVAAFFLDAPNLRQVLKLAQEGKTLPQKATYFYPKPPSGMVFERVGRDRRLY